MRAELRVAGQWLLDSDCRASGSGENWPAGSLSAANWAALSQWITLLDHKRGAQLVVFLCSCAVRVTDHREERETTEHQSVPRVCLVLSIL